MGDMSTVVATRYDPRLSQLTTVRAGSVLSQGGPLAPVTSFHTLYPLPGIAFVPKPSPTEPGGISGQDFPEDLDHKNHIKSILEEDVFESRPSPKPVTKNRSDGKGRAPNCDKNHLQNVGRVADFDRGDLFSDRRGMRVAVAAKKPKP